MSEFWHKEIIDVDLAIIFEQVQDFEMFYEFFIDAINKAKQQPFRPGWELRYGLKGWHEYKFFSVEAPAPGKKPDIRFIYYYDRDYRTIYILAVGFRNAKETRHSDEQHSIYYIATKRLKETEKDKWQMIK